MADEKITQLATDTKVHSDDALIIVDTHDTTMASSGTDKQITPAQFFSQGLDAAFGTTQGGVIYRGASGWAFLAPGSSGQVLESGGAGREPELADRRRRGRLGHRQQRVQRTGRLLCFDRNGRQWRSPHLPDRRSDRQYAG